MSNEYLLEEETYQILGACFEVYNEKGCGFTEPIYQECLEIELGLKSIPFAAKEPIGLEYKGHRLTKTFEPDFVCFGTVIVEIKAVSKLCDNHRSQVLNYLNATGIQVALLVNFGHHPKLEYERMVNQKKEARR